MAYAKKVIKKTTNRTIKTKVSNKNKPKTKSKAR